MNDRIDILRRMYDRFNAQDMDGVIRELAENIVWANAMDGGHEHGREAVRAYWARQWSQVRPQVEPVAFRFCEDGSLIAEVKQVILDLDGNSLQGQTHGLTDKTVLHVFQFEGSKVSRFDVAGPKTFDQ